MDNRNVDTAGASVVNRVSWGAILAGVFVAISVASMLNLLGLGLDLIAIGSHQYSFDHITILSIIWIVLSSIFAMFAGGWVAGRMCGPALATEGALHGIVMFSVSIFITFMLTTTVGSMIGVMSTIVGQGFAATHHAQMAKMNQHAPDNNTLHSLNMSKLSPQSQQQFYQGLHEYLIATNPEAESAARSKLNGMLMHDQGMTEAQANQMLDSWQQTKQNAVMQAEKATKGLGVIVLIVFVSFLLSAIASALGGARGASSDRAFFMRK